MSLTFLASIDCLHFLTYVLMFYISLYRLPAFLSLYPLHICMIPASASLVTSPALSLLSFDTCIYIGLHVDNSGFPW